MKKNTIIVSLLLIAFTRCAVQEKTTYDIPPEIPVQLRPELMANLEKGKELFKANCSGCHGIFTKGKDSIPNFTSNEIRNYLTAYQTNDTKNHAVMKKLLPEELSLIMTFLKMRHFKGKQAH